MLPERGPGIVYPHGVSGVLVVGGNTFPPAGSNPPQVQFRWPRRYMVRGMIITVNTGDPGDLSQLSLQIIDEQNLNMTTDGEGQQVQAGCMTFGGGPSGFGGPSNIFGPRFYAMQRLVQPNDIWKFRWANSKPRSELVPELGFLLAEPK